MAIDITSKINSVWWELRVALGLGVLLAGPDRLFNILTNWSLYLSPVAERWLPGSGHAFLLVVGVVEMLVGLAILTHWTRVGAYVAAIWLASIALTCSEPTLPRCARS